MEPLQISTNSGIDSNNHGKHKNYEILNLIGYGLAKFDKDFIKCLGFSTKLAFYQYMKKIGIAETTGTVKNRQDLFDPFFENGRKGWWQKGNAYIHRKIHIDSLFGTFDARAYANIVKLYLEKFSVKKGKTNKGISPVIKSKFKQLQITGREAELFFMTNYQQVTSFKDGILEDARIYGDGYDFQIEVQQHYYLAEIKGVRLAVGNIRMTENEYNKAKEYNNDYAIVVVSNLNTIPKMSVVFNPVKNITLKLNSINTKQNYYHSDSILWA